MRSLSILVGAAVGAMMASILYVPRLNELAASVRGFWMVFRVLHFPAELFGRLWSYMGVPPQGDAAIVVIPCLSVILQWLVVGIGVGLFLDGKRRRA